ncbi:MAG: YhfC family intramembrane metalloprotease [Lachnospiraceae bacterium]|jgi:uncharacterized membrane protein YhfC|nr:YhfC family intramembrane metalloprotease [Lachnospiraceae bacterium]
MISNVTIFSFAIAAVITLLLPIIIIIIMALKRKITLLPLLIGFAAFFLAQIVIRIPLLGILSGQSWFQTMAGQFFPYALFMCFTAGLFEESARLGGALFLKKKRSYTDAISFGLGHAFCEVLILIGLSHVNNLFIAIAVNNGSAKTILPPEMVETITAQMLSINPIDIYWGLLERVSAVLFHIFATVLVFQGVVKKKPYYYLLAIFAHTLFNLIALLLLNHAGIVLSESALFIAALAALAYVIKCRKDADLTQPVAEGISTN